MQELTLTGRWATDGEPDPGAWVVELVDGASPRARLVELTDSEERVIHARGLAWSRGRLVEGRLPAGTTVPVSDDPAFLQRGWLVRLRVTVAGDQPRDFYLSSAGLDGQAVDVSQLVDPVTYGADPGTHLRGVPGGVAALDSLGRVTDADGNVVGAGPGGVDLTPYATVAYVDQQDRHATMPNLKLLFKNGLI